MARRGVTFEMLGIKDFARSLDAISESTKDKLGAAMKTTATAIQARARINAPAREGDLSRAIKAEGKGLNWRVGIDDKDISSRGGRNSAHRNPSVYGVWYELGFKTRKIDSHPFMGPAVDTEEAAHDARVDQALDAGLKA